MKYLRSTLFWIIVLSGAMVLTGCGIPREDYDKVMGDLSSAQDSIHSLETNLSAATETITTLQDELYIQKEGYDQLMFEYDSLKSESDDMIGQAEAFSEEYVEQDALLKTYEDTLIAASDYMSIVIELYTPVFTGDGISDKGMIDNVKILVDQTGDEELLKLYDAWVSTPSDRNLASDILVHCFLKMEELIFS